MLQANDAWRLQVGVVLEGMAQRQRHRRSLTHEQQQVRHVYETLKLVRMPIPGLSVSMQRCLLLEAVLFLRPSMRLNRNRPPL